MQGLAEAPLTFGSESEALSAALERWLQAIVAVLGTDAAIAVLREPDRSRVLATHGLRIGFPSSAFNFKETPYSADEFIVVRDASDRPDLDAVLAECALERTHFFYRYPLLVEEGRYLAIIAFGREPRLGLTDTEIALAGEIASVARAEISRLRDDLKLALSVDSAGMNLETLKDWIRKKTSPLALVDSHLNVVEINQTACQERKVAREDIIGQSMTMRNLPAIDSLAFYFRKALSSGTSTPLIEVSETKAEIGTRHFSVMASPIRPHGETDLLLIVAFRDMTDDIRRRSSVESRLPAGKHRSIDATERFLFETLIERRSLRGRGDMSYVTVRTFRQSIKRHQIRALRALKTSFVDHLASGIAKDLQKEVSFLIGAAAFRAIVPIPCGHSSSDSCLSRAIALSLGAALNLPVIEALRLPQLSGSSHPRTNAKRPPMRLAREVDGPVLLVDDIVTSGRHLEEATLLLRPVAGSVLAMGWLGGEAGEGSEPT